MSKSPVLDLLRQIQTDVTELKSGSTELQGRGGLLEGGVAFLSCRADRIGGDVERTRTRFDLVDVPQRDVPQ